MLAQPSARTLFEIGNAKLAEIRDSRLLRLAWAMALTAVLSVTLMIAELLVAFDLVVPVVLLPDGTEVRDYEHASADMVDSGTTVALKVALLVLSIVQCLIVLAYYRVRVHRAGQAGRTLTLTRERKQQLALELAVNLFHPVPGVFRGRWDLLGLAMTLRLYSVVRLVHYGSSFYKDRVKYQLSAERGVCLTTRKIDVNWSASLKAGFESHPGRFTFVLLAMGYFGAAFLVFATERLSQPEVFASFSNVLWFAFVTMTTVGYGDMSPTSTFGRLATVFMGLVGIVLSALFVGTVTNKLALTYHQSRTLNAMKLHSLTKSHRRSAARYILYVWRDYRGDRGAGAGGRGSHDDGDVVLGIRGSGSGSGSGINSAGNNNATRPGQPRSSASSIGGMVVNEVVATATDVKNAFRDKVNNNLGGRSSRRMTDAVFRRRYGEVVHAFREAGEALRMHNRDKLAATDPILLSLRDLGERLGDVEDSVYAIECMVRGLSGIPLREDVDAAADAEAAAAKRHDEYGNPKGSGGGGGAHKDKRSNTGSSSGKHGKEPRGSAALAASPSSSGRKPVKASKHASDLRRHKTFPSSPLRYASGGYAPSEYGLKQFFFHQRMQRMQRLRARKERMEAWGRTRVSASVDRERAAVRARLESIESRGSRDDSGAPRSGELFNNNGESVVAPRRRRQSSSRDLANPNPNPNNNVPPNTVMTDTAVSGPAAGATAEAAAAAAAAAAALPSTDGGGDHHPGPDAADADITTSPGADIGDKLGIKDASVIRKAKRLAMRLHVAAHVIADRKAKDAASAEKLDRKQRRRDRKREERRLAREGQQDLDGGDGDAATSSSSLASSSSSTASSSSSGSSSLSSSAAASPHGITAEVGPSSTSDTTSPERVPDPRRRARRERRKGAKEDKRKLLEQLEEATTS
jgi:voltage-gated potassium channel Kch